MLRSVVYRAGGMYSLVNRRRKARIVIGLARDLGARSVLFVGVGAGEEDRTNLFERLVAAELPDVVATGLDATAVDFCSTYVRSDGLALPFADRSFDLVVSNAVVEHVGDESSQRRFVAEHLRVGRASVITTPNRLFPIEAHTGVVLRHCRKGWRDDDGYVTRLLSRGELRRLLPSGATTVGRTWSPTLIGIVRP